MHSAVPHADDGSCPRLRLVDTAADTVWLMTCVTGHLLCHNHLWGNQSEQRIFIFHLCDHTKIYQSVIVDNLLTRQ